MYFYSRGGVDIDQARDLPVERRRFHFKCIEASLKAEQESAEDKSKQKKNRSAPAMGPSINRPPS